MKKFEGWNVPELPESGRLGLLLRDAISDYLKDSDLCGGVKCDNCIFDTEDEEDFIRWWNAPRLSQYRPCTADEYAQLPDEQRVYWDDRFNEWRTGDLPRNPAYVVEFVTLQRAEAK